MIVQRNQSHSMSIMIKKYLLLMVACCFCVPTSFAADTDTIKPVKKTAAERKKEQLEKFDKDGDGRLNGEEKKALKEAEKLEKEEERAAKKAAKEEAEEAAKEAKEAAKEARMNKNKKSDSDE